MIRLIVLFMFILGCSGTALYMTKLSIDKRHDELRHTQARVKAEERRFAILAAEWAYLSRPERLLSLSNKLLSMRPISPNQIVSLDAIPIRQIAPISSVSLAEEDQNGE